MHLASTCKVGSGILARPIHTMHRDINSKSLQRKPVTRLAAQWHKKREDSVRNQHGNSRGIDWEGDRDTYAYVR